MIRRIIKFSSSSCMPCKMQEQILNEIKDEYKLIIADFKAESDKYVFDQFQITKLPTLLLVTDEGYIKNKIEGIILKDKLIEELKE